MTPENGNLGWLKERRNNVLRPEIFFYRDDKGRLRKTRSGHYRFDIRLSRENGKAYATINGFRFDYPQKKIISPTLMTQKGIFVVAEVAPHEHDNLADQVHKLIHDELEEARIAANGGY